MKITGKKDIAAEKLRGRAAIDAVYVPRINTAMGPKFALYQMKTEHACLFGNSATIADIRRRNRKSLDAIVSLENERQAAQARVDAATSAAEIDTIIAGL